jgi:D-glycero-alpha-D-manno-heptose-7-phosphate kinase
MRSLVQEIQRRLLVFYTGVTRSASGILAQQQANITSNSEKEASLRHMLELVEHVRCEFEKSNALVLGEVLHECWMIKRRLAKGITSEEIDNWYHRARNAGAIGGKILGAGGGGFLLIFAPPDRHEGIIRALPELRRVKLGFDRIGTAIIFSEPNQYELDQDEKLNVTASRA